MPKPEWGVKRTCLSCGSRFYDLMREPVICPKCDTEFDTAVLQKPKRLRPATIAKAAVKAAPEKDEDLIDDGDDDDDDDAVIDPDADDDDMAVDTDADDNDNDVITSKGDDDDLLDDDDADIGKIETGDEELKDS